MGGWTDEILPDFRHLNVLVLSTNEGEVPLIPHHASPRGNLHGLLISCMVLVSYAGSHTVLNFLGGEGRRKKKKR